MNHHIYIRSDETARLSLVNFNRVLAHADTSTMHPLYDTEDVL